MRRPTCTVSCSAGNTTLTSNTLRREGSRLRGACQRRATAPEASSEAEVSLNTHQAPAVPKVGLPSSRDLIDRKVICDKDLGSSVLWDLSARVEGAPPGWGDPATSRGESPHPFPTRAFV